MGEERNGGRERWGKKEMREERVTAINHREQNAFI